MSDLLPTITMAALAEGRKSGRKRRLSLKAELNRKTEVNKHAKKMKEDEMVMI